MDNNTLELKNYMDFENSEIFNEVMDWAIKEIFQKIWTEEEWSKCAKGGRHIGNPNFEKYSDMAYPVHIFSGVAMSMKVFDYYFSQNNSEIAEYLREKFKEKESFGKLLKRAILGYVFHDFNKITDTNYQMIDKEPLFKLIDRHFKNLSEDLGLNYDNIYQIAMCTEKGTEANVLRDSVIIFPGLDFEMNFSRLSDVLSGIYNHENIAPNRDIKFGPYTLISKEKINSISIASTNLYAMEGLAKKAVVAIIRTKLKGFYLWSTENTIFYVNDNNPISKREMQDFLVKEFKSLISEVMHPERLISMNDRSVNSAASGYIDYTRHSIIAFMRNGGNVRSCVHLQDINLDNSDKIIQGEKFSDLISNYKNSIFSLNLRFVKDKKGAHSIRDGLNVLDDTNSDENEMLKVFDVRYIQLNKQLKDEEIDKIRMKISNLIEDFKNEFDQILGKDPAKSALLIPILIKEDVDWDKISKKVLEDMNKKSKDIDYNIILGRIIPEIFTPEEFPEVPEKSRMSMVNGFQASEVAKGDNLYGLNTNGFNNRLKTSKISNGKVDDVSILEFNVRRNIIPKISGDETLVYLNFPGAVPYLDMSLFIDKFSNSKNGEQFIIDRLRLSIESMDQKVKVDNSFFFVTYAVKSNADMLRVLNQAVDIAGKTKMHVRISYSNSPLLSGQLESIKFDISNSIVSFFSWNSIRCNELSKVRKTLQTFNVLANGSLEKFDYKKMTEVIIDFTQNTMSVFSYVHNHISELVKHKKHGFGEQFSKAIDDIRKMGYNVEKKGDEHMKNIEKLAKIASNIENASWKMSGNDRTWMLRDSLEALETVRVKTKDGDHKDLSEFKDIVGGVLLTKVTRDLREEGKNFVPVDKVVEFADCVIELIEKDFGGRIPSGATKSYLINAFEFEYMLTIGKR